MVSRGRCRLTTLTIVTRDPLEVSQTEELGTAETAGFVSTGGRQSETLCSSPTSVAGNRFPATLVGELHKVSDCLPPVLTNPAVSAVPSSSVWLTSRGSLVTIVKVVRRHHPLETIVLGNQEADSQFVEISIPVCENASGPLVVVIVNKHQSVKSVRKPVSEVL